MSDDNYLHFASNATAISDPNANYDEHEKDKVSSSGKSIQNTVWGYLRKNSCDFFFF